MQPWGHGHVQPCSRTGTRNCFSVEGALGLRDMGLGMRLMRLKRVPWEIGVGAGLVKSGKACGRDCPHCSSAEHQVAQR